MEREYSADQLDLAQKLERLDREELRTTFRSLHLACAAAGFSVDELLAKPASEVIPFAQANGIDIRDLRDICELMIQRLDALDQEFAASEKRQSN